MNKFNNIERIEVLNGPQGTLFGRNATGGAIRIITRDPGDRMEFNGQFGFANYDTVSGQAYFSAPLSDNVGWNVAFTGQDQGKGFGFNTTLNKLTKQDDYWSLRTKLVAKAGENLKITLSGDYYSTNNDFALQLFPIRSTTATRALRPDRSAGQDSPARFPSLTQIRAWGVSGKIEFDARLRRSDQHHLLPQTQEHQLVRRRWPGGQSGHLEYFAPSSSFQQELRLSSKTTEPLAWQVGAFYIHNVVEQDQYQRGAAFRGTQSHIVAKGITDSISLFGEATYAITPSPT